jgi:CHAT domain-containing protein/tetratricopeptide (TPR) repeat protein
VAAVALVPGLSVLGVAAPAGSGASIDALLRGGRYEEALVAARASLEAAETQHGPDAPGTADAIDRLVDVLWRTGRTVEPATRKLAERAAAIRRSRADEAGLASSLTNLGIVQAAAAEFRPAQESLEEALALRQKVSGPDAPNVALVKERLAALLANVGNAGRARELLDQSVAALDRDPVAHGADLAAVLTTLGGFLTNRGDLAGARDALSRALEIRTGLYGPDHPETAATIYRQAYLKRKEGDTVGALDLVRRVVAIREAKLAPGSNEIASALGLSADLRIDRGDLPGARADIGRALEMRRAALGPKHPMVATSLKTLAGILLEAGDYADARPLFEQTLAIEREALGPEHPQVALTMTYLGDVLFKTGDLHAAVVQYEQALLIAEKKLPSDHPQRTMLVASLANTLAQLGREDEARTRLQGALASLERSLPPDHPQVGVVLQLLAESFERTGDYEHGADLLVRARGIFESRGPDSFNEGEVLKVLGTIRRGQGRLQESGDAFARAVAIYEQGAGPDHPMVADILTEWGMTLWRSGDRGRAMDCSLRASRIRREALHNASGYMSEREALRYRSRNDDALDLALSALASRAEEGSLGDGIVDRVWDEVIRSRAQVLDEVASRERLAHASDTPEGEALVSSLEEARTRLARLTLALYGAGGKEVSAGAVEEARQNKEAAERALAAWSAVYRETQSLRDVGSREIRAALPSRSALVAYVRYGRYALPVPAGGTAPAPAPRASVPSYIAVVLRPSPAESAVVPLGPADKVEARVREWRKEAGAPPVDRDDLSRYRAAAGSLARAIWRPIAPLVGDADIVLVVPDGALQFVSWGALPGASGKYVEEGPALVHVLSAERDVARTGVQSPQGKGLLALGGPDFDAAIPEAGQGPAAAPCATSTMRFDALPDAAAEARDIGRLWSAGDGSAPDPSSLVTVLTGGGASESAFRSLAPGRRIIHLATHGFFLEHGCPGTLGARPEAPDAESALLRTGLALAGANSGWSAESAAGARDGLLTAEEIASVDLRGVEWAILSACGSSLGSVEAGEGVLGLRRSFEIAGARSLITSLWTLDDHTTREWIHALYEARLKGASTAGAVREADLAVLRARRRAGLSDHPYYWAPFVAAGDWR